MYLQMIQTHNLHEHSREDCPVLKKTGWEDAERNGKQL